jgi:hypothetical protein
MIEYPAVPVAIMTTSKNKDIRNFTISITIQIGQSRLPGTFLTSTVDKPTQLPCRETGELLDRNQPTEESYFRIT